MKCLSVLSGLLKLRVVGLGLLCFVSLIPTTAYALERYVAGVHYKIVAPQPSKTATAQVISFFSYACPHCDHLEPLVKEWREKLPESVAFERVPVQWNPFFLEMATLYHTLQALNLAEKHGQAIFDAIHKTKHSLHTEGAILSFLQTQGLEKALIKDTLHSKPVKKQLRKDRAVIAQYRVSGVPSFVVNGRYFVDIRSAGSKDELFHVLDHLLEK